MMTDLDGIPGVCLTPDKRANRKLRSNGRWSCTGTTAFVTHAALVELQFLEVPLQVSSAEKLRRSILPVSPRLADHALHHPFARAGVSQAPIGIVLRMLHIR
jgi:hypothetical protein